MVHIFRVTVGNKPARRPGALVAGEIMCIGLCGAPTHTRDGGGGGCTENAVCLHRVGQTIQNGVIVVVVVCELAFTASQKSEYYLSNLALASNALMHHSKQNKLPCVMYNAKEPANIWHAIPYCK